MEWKQIVFHLILYWVLNQNSSQRVAQIHFQQQHEEEEVEEGTNSQPPIQTQLWQVRPPFTHSSHTVAEMEIQCKYNIKFPHSISVLKIISQLILSKETLHEKQ